MPVSFVALVLVGFGAQLVDGALGMAYGVTSSTLLLSMGLVPAAASASVHLAEVGTTLASGVSHWRMRNLSRAVVFHATPDWAVPLRDLMDDFQETRGLGPKHRH